MDKSVRSYSLFGLLNMCELYPKRWRGGSFHEYPVDTERVIGLLFAFEASSDRTLHGGSFVRLNSSFSDQRFRGEWLDQCSVRACVSGLSFWSAGFPSSSGTNAADGCEERYGK